MMDTSKSKLHIGKKSKPVKLGSSTSSSSMTSNSPSTKKDYSKNQKEDGFAVPSFGMTGMTGES